MFMKRDEFVLQAVPYYLSCITSYICTRSLLWSFPHTNWKTNLQTLTNYFLFTKKQKRSYQHLVYSLVGSTMDRLWYKTVWAPISLKIAELDILLKIHLNHDRLMVCLLHKLLLWNKECTYTLGHRLRPKNSHFIKLHFFMVLIYVNLCCQYCIYYIFVSFFLSE